MAYIFKEIFLVKGVHGNWSCALRGAPTLLIYMKICKLGITTESYKLDITTKSYHKTREWLKWESVYKGVNGKNVIQMLTIVKKVFQILVKIWKVLWAEKKCIFIKMYHLCFNWYHWYINIIVSIFSKASKWYAGCVYWGCIFTYFFQKSLINFTRQSSLSSELVSTVLRF